MSCLRGRARRHRGADLLGDLRRTEAADLEHPGFLRCVVRFTDHAGQIRSLTIRPPLPAPQHRPASPLVTEPNPVLLKRQIAATSQSRVLRDRVNPPARGLYVLPARQERLTTRREDAGWFSNPAAGRIGLRTSSPSQFGQTPRNVTSAQSRHHVHSKVRMNTSRESGARSRSQHSQFGLISSMGRVYAPTKTAWICDRSIPFCVLRSDERDLGPRRRRGVGATLTG
jgi:hypothetical protein